MDREGQIAGQTDEGKRLGGKMDRELSRLTERWIEIER